MKNYTLFDIYSKNFVINEILDSIVNISDKKISLKKSKKFYEYSLDSSEKIKFSNTYSKISIQPVLLGKPVYIHVKDKITIFPKEKINFFIQRPLNAEVIVSNDTTSFKISSFQIYDYSLTNYGTVNDPMVCFYIESDIVTKPKNGNYALVPITLINNHTSPVVFSKLIIYKNFLNLFATPDFFTTNKISVKINSSESAFIEYSDTTDETFKILKKYNFENINDQPIFFNILKSFKKKGTGIEYGF